MPELFTLTKLQQVYEVIQGKELLAAAFRRKVANMVIETNEFTKDAGHRPSKLFRYNSGWKRN
jgi:8-oxo-dGTP diphosphatase